MHTTLVITIAIKVVYMYTELTNKRCNTFANSIVVQALRRVFGHNVRFFDMFYKSSKTLEFIASVSLVSGLIVYRSIFVYLFVFLIFSSIPNNLGLILTKLMKSMWSGKCVLLHFCWHSLTIVFVEQQSSSNVFSNSSLSLRFFYACAFISDSAMSK